MRVEKQIIAIGSSTGGPTALQQILFNIEKGFQVPILIVQHLPSGFTKMLANRLNGIGTMRVKEAEHGEQIYANTAYVAPGGFHMEVRERARRLFIHLTENPTRLGHRPSVNELLDSMAKLRHYKKMVVIVTGMGKDGAEGIIKLKEHDEKAIILAESGETAVINGMPAAAVATGHVTEIVPLDKIGKAIVKHSER